MLEKEFLKRSEIRNLRKLNACDIYIFGFHGISSAFNSCVYQRDNINK
jgi:hypothetical protein